jgi:hypothetical protein
MPATVTLPKLSYPRPELRHRHEDLFREPAYEDGQPYTDDDLEDETGG